MLLGEKIVTFCENGRSIISGFTDLCLKSHVLLYFWRKKHTKNTMHVAEKNATLWENWRSSIKALHGK